MSGNDGDEADNSKAKAGPSGRSKGSKGPKRLYPEEDNSSSQDSVVEMMDTDDQGSGTQSEAAKANKVKAKLGGQPKRQKVGSLGRSRAKSRSDSLAKDDDPTPTAQQVPPTTPNYVVMNAAAVSSSYQQITTVLSEMKGSIATSQPVTKSEFHEFGRQVESTLTTMQKTQKDFMAQMGSFALRGRGARSRHRSSHHSRKGKERASGPNPFAMETDADNEADDQDDAANDTGNETWKERAERKLIEMGEFSKDSMRSSLLRALRHHFKFALGIAAKQLNGNHLYEKLGEPYTDAEMEKLECGTITLVQLGVKEGEFKPDFSRSSSTTYNQRAIDLFASSFCSAYESGLYGRYDIKADYVDEVKVGEAFTQQFAHYSALWKEGRKKKSDDLRVAVEAMNVELAKKKKNRASSNGRQIFNTRLQTMECDETLLPYKMLVISAGPGSGSHDDSDPDMPSTLPRDQRMKRFAPSWRSQEYENLLYAVDRVTQDLQQSKLQLNAGVHIGAIRRARPVDIIYQEKKAPKGLPLNCYSRAWYETLGVRDKMSLNAARRVKFNLNDSGVQTGAPQSENGGDSQEVQKLLSPDVSMKDGTG